jgi:hypothetical protein
MIKVLIFFLKNFIVLAPWLVLLTLFFEVSHTYSQGFSLSVTSTVSFNLALLTNIRQTGDVTERSSLQLLQQ